MAYGVFDDDKVPLVFEWDAQIGEERFGGLPHHHCAEELPAEPGPASGGYAGFDNGDFEVWSLLAEHVGC